MGQIENFDNFIGLVCVFPSYGIGFVANTSHSTSYYKIQRVEEISVRFGGIPYIRFQTQSTPMRIVELLGAWTIVNDETFANS